MNQETNFPKYPTIASRPQYIVPYLIYQLLLNLVSCGPSILVEYLTEMQIPYLETLSYKNGIQSSKIADRAYQQIYQSLCKKAVFFKISYGLLLSSHISSFLNTVFFSISEHRWCKINCPLIGGVHLLESFSISVLISRIKHFSISIMCSWVD